MVVVVGLVVVTVVLETVEFDPLAFDEADDETLVALTCVTDATVELVVVEVATAATVVPLTSTVGV